MSHQTLAYRRDIDGLRAIAVVSVVVYHAFPNLLPGGFIGVDIFFVISGFLITGILIREQERSGRIDLAEFYARRVRRLLPALLFMLIATLVLGYVSLPATGELQSLAKSTLATLFFASNVFFALQPSGYFAAAPEAFPLLHTWTLAVEEQFYLVWPLLIPMTATIADRIGQSRRTALGLMFGAVLVISLALCIVVTGWRPSLAFYLTPFRSWEFAIGALLSLIMRGDQTGPIRGATTLSLAGLGLIAGSLWGFRSDTVFPGWIALVPTMGAACLLAAGVAKPSNPVARLLSLRPMVYVGQLSYGWYLWHWPLLALLRAYGLGQASTPSIILAVAASFVLSAISFHFVEKPIRTQSWILFRTTRTSLTAGTLMLLAAAATAIGVAAFANHELALSPRLQAVANATRTDAMRTDFPISCNNYENTFRKLTPFRQCMIGQRDARRIVVVLGDSHGQHLQPMLDRWGRERNIAILPRALGGCRPFLKDPPKGLILTPMDLAKCGGFNNAIFSELRDLAHSGRVMAVVVGVRWSANDIPFVSVGSDHTTALDPASWLGQLVALANTANFRVVITRDTPTFPFDVPQCLARRSILACGVDRTTADMKRAGGNGAITKLMALEPAVRAFDPSNVICDKHFCYPERGNVVLFKDMHHLSIVGSQALEPRLRTAIDRALLSP